MQAFRPLQRYFELSGRSGRAEFWQFYLLTIGVNWLATIVDGFRGGPYNPALPIATYLVAVGSFIPSVTVAVRRLHDRGRSGFWLWFFYGSCTFTGVVIGAGEGYYRETGSGKEIAVIGYLLIVPCLINLIFLIREWASKGDAGHNGYGPPDVVPADSFKPLDTIRTLSQPRPSTPAAPTMNEALASIEQLGKLKEQGLITDEEFAAQKARLLTPGS